MKITCGSCAAKYTVSDDKVQGKTVKVKCRKCGAVIVVNSSGEVQTSGVGATAGATAVAASSATYTVSITDTDQRSMTLPQLIEAYNEGVIDAETYVWAEGMDDWQPLKDVDAIVDALHEAATGGDGQQAAYQGEDLAATVAVDQGGGYGAVAAAGGYGASYGASYGSDLGATVAMPEAAAALSSGSGHSTAQSSGSQLSGSGRGGTAGSFFGGVGSGSSFADVGHSPATAGAAPTGNENSAIFSLNMLTAKVEDKAPSRGGTEDSGLIDLKALAQGMGDSGGVAAADPAPLADGGLFPLGAPVPQVPLASAHLSMAPPAQTGSGRGLIIGLVGAIVLLGAGLVFVIVRGGEPPPVPTTSTQAAPTPAPAPVPTPTATTEPASTGSAAASASASAGPLAKGRPIPRPGPGGPGPGPAAAPKKASTPTTGACGCASEDLMCQMRCATPKKK